LLHTTRTEETSDAVRQRVQAARKLAEERQGCSNQCLNAGMLEAHIHLDDAARSFLNHAATRLGWSGRGTHRTLKVARTLADLSHSKQVLTEHVAEALQYRPAI
jgi:magnesium chelatase family protein